VREAISELHEVPADGIVVGAGSVELIWSLARAFGGPGRRGLVVSPAFGEYEQALKASGSSVVEVQMQAPLFDLPCDVLEARLAEAPIAVVFICRPSNPCLTVAPAETLAALARRWPRVLFVIDEAYLPMFEGSGALPPGPNVAILRSLTKLFALPGLRLGYMLATAPIAHAVQAALPPWNVSSPAQAVGIVAASVLPSVVAPIRARIAALRSSLHERLTGIAGSAEHAGGPFLLYRSEVATALVHHLRRRGILVRHGASFGLPMHVRIGVRAEADQDALIRAWRDFASSTSDGNAA
jgi:histidinol-phosphate/aromatic aminotransferase/cobyric acid decarboxylase-like protein